MVKPTRWGFNVMRLVPGAMLSLAKACSPPFARSAASAALVAWRRSGGFSRLGPPQAGEGQGLWPWWNRPTHPFFLFSCGPPQAGRTRRRNGKGEPPRLTDPGPKGRGYTAGGSTAGGQGR